MGRQVGLVEGVAHNIANDVNALTQAWSEANAEVFKGVVSVLSNLLIDVNESVAQVPRRQSARRHEARADEDPRTRERDDDPDSEEIADSVSRVGRSLSDALNQAAGVIQHSSERFQKRFQETVRSEVRHRDESDGDHNRPDDHREGSHTETAEEAREREFKETTERRES